MSNDYGFVYLIENQHGNTKIGCTENSVPKRFQHIKHLSRKHGGVDVECHYHAYVPNYQFVEKDLHARFRSRHFESEWFNETADKIAELTSDIPWMKGQGQSHTVSFRMGARALTVSTPPKLFQLFWDECAANDMTGADLFNQILSDRYQILSDDELPPCILDSEHNTID